MTEPTSAQDLFKGRHFDQEIIILCVRWYLAFKLSSRDMVQMMAERGILMAHDDASAAEISNKLFSSGVCNSMKRLVLLLLAISAIIVTSLPVKADEDRGDHNWNDEYWHHNHEGYWHGHKGHWEYKHHKHTFIQVGPVTIEQH
jgi:hypothetical protein